MTDVLLLALVALFGSYLVVDADVFAPILDPVERWAEQSWAWLHTGMTCTMCTGTWATLVVAAMYWGRFDLVDIVAANGVHYAMRTAEEAMA